jgi:peptide/nickel transport system substrate-binding protein
LVALVTVLALVGAACGGGSETPTGSGATTSGGQDLSGGTIREELPEFGWVTAFDPTGEYLGYAWGLYSQLLLRGLMTYNHKPASEGGDTPVPDLATAEPEISDDGMTYTFTIRDDAMFGPPVSRPITTADILFAFQRINTATPGALYGNYYCGVIVGMTCDVKAPKAGGDYEPIEGIETPDDTTIVFHLERPTGDLLYRLSMPATTAMPKETAGCFPDSYDYGSYITSSGPYMVLGSDELDASSCDALLASGPLSGYDVEKGMTIVRNPDWDIAQDNPENRSAYVDGIELAINTNIDDSFDKLMNGDLDLVQGTPPTAVLQTLLTDPESPGTLHADQGDRTWYVTMNLLAPPFDDPAVRAAVNLALNKDGMRRAYGGESRGELATSVEPPTVLEGSEGINPYADNTGEGNLDAAKEAMKGSMYDTDGDGVCDAPECSKVLFLGRNTDPWPDINQVVVESLTPLGLDLVLREVDTSTGYTTLQTAKRLVPISAVPGWGKDYADPYGFDYFIFSSDGILCEGASNYSLLGITADQATECGIKAEYDAFIDKWGEMPSIDDQINDECFVLSGEERTACFQQMDTYLMETGIPWAPWLWATNFTSTNNENIALYTFDQNSGVVSYVHTAVNNDLQPTNVAA